MTVHGPLTHIRSGTAKLHPSSDADRRKSGPAKSP